MGRTTGAGEPGTGDGGIAIVGGGPSGLVLAIALARQGIASTIFEREVHPFQAPRFNPDRSYTIDISGHGLRAIRHIEASSFFDERLLPFKGLKLPDGKSSEWTLPGWTGSRGDILRSLGSLAESKHDGRIALHHESKVSRVDVRAGTVAFATGGAEEATRRFDLVVGGDGAGSVVRAALVEQVAGFTVAKHSYPNYSR